MIREVFVVVTASDGWFSSHGIDMLASQAFKDQPVGFTMDGWTVAARLATPAEADLLRQEARQQQNRDSCVLIFFEDASGVDDGSCQ